MHLTVTSFCLCNCRTLIITQNYCKPILIRQLLSTMAQSDQCFKGKLDRYNAVIVNSKEEQCELAVFPKRLTASLEEWTQAKRNAVWFEVDAKDSDWIPILIKEKFKFHQAKEDRLLLYKWLKDSACTIPHCAHTNIGVGAFVYKEDTKEILVIKEKNAVRNWWKLPGGYMEPKENINQAVEREVLEETGVEAKFECILGFRHGHQSTFGCSDIYIITHLIPKSFDVKKCPKEISQCQWMKLEEYAQHPEVNNNNKFIAKKMMEHLETGVGLRGTQTIHPITKQPVIFYSINNGYDKS